MKKILVIIVLSIVLISNIKLDRTSIKKEEETRAIFVSYIELNKYIKGNDYEISNDYKIPIIYFSFDFFKYFCWNVI